MKKQIQAQPIKNPLAKFLILGFSTAGGLGYAPLAPGTAGSLLGIPLGLWLLGFPTLLSLGICLVLTLIFSPVSHRASLHWGEMDCGRIVIDEVIGQAITLLGLKFLFESQDISATHFWSFVGGAFVIFRALDILKPFPAKLFERNSTSFGIKGLGIIADDVVAGLYGALIIRGISKIWMSTPSGS